MEKGGILKNKAQSHRLHSFHEVLLKSMKNILKQNFAQWQTILIILRRISTLLTQYLWRSRYYITQAQVFQNLAGEFLKHLPFSTFRNKD